MDNGKDLGASPMGPWMAAKNVAVSSFPIIQHHPKMTARNLTPPIFASHTSASGENRMPQSGSMLPLQYDSLLSMVDRSRQSSREPFHALAPLFRFAAFSEVQFLNLMEGQIDDELAPLPPESTRIASLDNLQYLMGILDRHIRQLRHCIRAIRRLAQVHEGSDPHTQPPERRKRNGADARLESDTNEPHHITSRSTCTVAAALLEDHLDLLTRCQELRERCEMDMNIMMNRSVVLESRKAIEQADRVKRLTMLATFFIPLTFSTSLFGMNFQEIWPFFAVAIPLTVIAYVCYIYKVELWVVWVWKFMRHGRLPQKKA